MKGEKKCLKVVKHVISEEKYKWVRLKVVMRWSRIGEGSVYCVDLRGLVFGILYL